MKKTNLSLAIVASLSLLSMIFGSTFVFNSFRYFQSFTSNNSAAVEEIFSEVKSSARKVSDEIHVIVPHAQSLAKDLIGAKAGGPFMKSRLRRALAGNGIVGVGMISIPSDKTNHSSAYACFRESDSFRFLNIDDDSEKIKNLFPGIETSQACWHEEFFCSESGREMLYYSVPFAHSTGNNGRVFVGTTVEAVSILVEQLESKVYSRFFLISPSGAVKNPGKLPGKLLSDYGEMLVSKARLADSEKSKSPFLTVKDPTSQSSYLLTSINIPGTGWKLGAAFSQTTGFSETLPPRRAAITVFSHGVLFILFFGLMLMKVAEGRNRELVCGAVFSTGLFSVGIFTIWLIVLYYPVDLSGIARNKTDFSKHFDSVVFNRLDVGKVLMKKIVDSSFGLKEPLIFIPTRIFVQSLSLSGLDQASVSGYIRQDYPDGLSDDLKGGVVFPNAESTTFSKVHRTEENGKEIWLWHFHTVLCTELNYSWYPLDQQEIKMQLMPTGLGRNVILIPDFVSSGLFERNISTGISKEFSSPGWSLDKSYFEFSACGEEYPGGFIGMGNRNRFPELVFNILLRRKFMGPFFVNILPLAVVFFFTFIVLLLSEKYDAMSVMTRITPLLFVVVVAHVSLRGSISADSVIYIEYLYILTYLVVLLVSVNSLVLSSDRPVSILRYNKNLVAKLAYWPFVTGILFLVTIMVFCR